MHTSPYSNSTHPPTARRLATVEGWLHQPADNRGQPSEGHTSAVNVLRMVNSRHEHTATEPVPFRAKPAPLLQAWGATHPTTHCRAQGCAGTGGACISHPDCPDVHCEGHPDNMGEQAVEQARKKAHRDSIFLLGGGAVAVVGLVWLLWKVTAS